MTGHSSGTTLEIGMNGAASPFQFLQDRYLLPVAMSEGVSPDQLEPILREFQKLPRKKWECKEGIVWSFPSKEGLECYLREMMDLAASLGLKMYVIGKDIGNLSGINAFSSEVFADQMVVYPLLELAMRSCNGLCQLCAGWFWQMFHYGGGDEYLTVVIGPDERTLTTALDTMVRESVAYSREQGLDLIPHGKKWWRIPYWGTRWTYGWSVCDPAHGLQKSPEQMLREAFVLVQKCKRGMKFGEQDPMDITLWDQIRRMARMPKAIVYKLFGVDIHARATWLALLWSPIALVLAICRLFKPKKRTKKR